MVDTPACDGQAGSMAHLRCDFFSDTLALSTSMTVILPQATSAQIGMTGRHREGLPPVLYLLHGLSDDDTIWLRRTSIERYVAPLGLAVVMPQVHRSFYTDEAAGGRYWTFLSEELPELVGSFFRVSPARADSFVAGLSMGGYGALKWALRQPDRFAAAASLSGAVDVERLRAFGGRPEDPGLLTRVLGTEPVTGTPNDIAWLLSRADRATLPALWVGCGTEDPLYADSERLVAACEADGIAVTTSFTPGGHDWSLWDEEIQKVLAWLPLAA
jgi:S-formylglutathione hydrolase FrmB